MKKWLVKRTVQLSKVIEADTREEALEAFGDYNADTKLIKETATIYLGENSLIRRKVK